MASYSGTFTVANTASDRLYLRPGEVVRVILTLTGTMTVRLDQVLGLGQAFQTLVTFTATTTGTDYRNETRQPIYVQLSCIALGSGSSVAYTLADISGDQILQELRAADGTLVWRVTDQGPWESPLLPMRVENVDGDNGENWTWNPDANHIASDVEAVVISGGGNDNNPQLIGYLEYRDRYQGDAAENEWDTTFDVASASLVRVRLIRTDKVRVTITSFCTITIVGGKAHVLYPQPGHFVNNAIGGSEGTDPFVLTTEQIEIVGIVSTENLGSGSNFSGIYGGYDNIIQEGVMQHILGAHHRIVAGDHNTILGGSYGRIDAGTYCVILGGTANEISISGTGSAIIGGNGNTIDTLGPCWIIGGSANHAGGAFAFIGGGSDNDVTGNGAFVGGRSNTISGRDALVGGFQNLIDDVYCFVAGLQNIVSGAYSGAMGRENSVTGESAYGFGRSLTVSGESATASGRSNTASAIGSDARGVNANSRLPYGETRAGTFFTTLGDAQTSVIPLRVETANSTPVELLIAGTTRITIPTDTTWTFSVLIVARRTDADNESAGYKIEGVIDNNAGTTALVGSPVVTVLAEDTAAWDVSATADNTNDALSINVTGENAKTIRWVGRLTLVEVTG